MAAPAKPGQLRVLALTSTDTAKHLTWRLRVELLLPHLAAQGIAVSVQRLPKGERITTETFSTAKRFDVAWIHRRLFWPAEMQAVRRLARAAVLDIDDPVCYSSSSPFNFSLSRCLRFRATVRGRAAAVMAANEGLKSLARRLDPPVFLVPLCADPDAYAMSVRPRLAGEPLRLLWLGSRSTYKYLAHIVPQLEAVGQATPGATLTVVGHAALHLQHMKVINRPWNPHNEKQAFLEAHVGLAPMVENRWTRAKAALKPLQYLASGLPFIGSPVGANLDYVDGGRNGFLAGDNAEWVAAVRRLDDDEELRCRLGQNGVTFVRQKHSPEVLAQQVADVFRDVSHRASAAA